MTTNIGKLRDAMAGKRIPAMLVSEIDNVRWATGFTGSNGFLLLTPTDQRFVTDSRYTLQAKEQVPGVRVEVYNSATNANEFLAGQAAEMGLKQIGFEADAVTYAAHRKLSEKFAGIELLPVENLFPDLRVVKTADEIETTRRSCKLADACFDHVRRMIQVGVAEFDIGLEIEFFFRRNGADLSFDPIVVSGERSARPHGRASEKKLERGDFLTLDFGGKLDGYCSDETRTVVIGEATDRHREVYDAVLKSQLAALEAMKPGVKASEVDRISREAMGDLAQYFGHGLGHGLGRVVHDSGRLSSTSETVLAKDQIWTVEPGAYIPGFGGVRIEDDVVVTDDGIEILTHSPKEMLILG
ncbi:MAG TPA: Xaa-Pro peptidase family protein [Fimbriimonadaceae bacterium]|nr:Xaa-Pro peptidase family protein [Fimbriimonadaceae bacterium]